MFKLPCNCSLHVLGRLCSKSYKLGFNNMWTKNYQDIQVVFRKGRATRDQIFNIHWIVEKAMEFQKKHLLLLYWLCKAFGWITVNRGKFLKIGVQDHLICLLRNLYAGQEAMVRTGHGTVDWFKSRKGVLQGCILSPWLFNLHAEYIMWNAGLDESQAGIKIARRNNNHLRYADIAL